MCDATWFDSLRLLQSVSVSVSQSVSESVKGGVEWSWELMMSSKNKTTRTERMYVHYSGEEVGMAVEVKNVIWSHLLTASTLLPPSPSFSPFLSLHAFTQV